MVKLEPFVKCDLLIKNTAENEKYLNFSQFSWEILSCSEKPQCFGLQQKTIKIFLHVFSFTALPGKAFSKEAQAWIH